jgi:epoxyqueuosine reductase
MNGTRSYRSGASGDHDGVNKSPSWKVHMMMADRDDMMVWMGDKIKNYAQQSTSNRLGPPGAGRIFDDPIVGFASGADPLFQELKEVIGPFHLTPHEVLAEEARWNGIPLPKAEETGIIAYVLPIVSKTREENSEMSSAPSHRWAYTRLHGEEFNKGLERYIVTILRELGYLAVAPDLSPSFKTVMDERIGPASTWSHRHVAFAAGLGTFGLSDGLITKAGIAHRLGSVVVNIPFPSPKRGGLHDDCLYYRTGQCMACAKRCPAGAITKDGHDKVKCREFVFSQVPYVREHYNLDIYACGLCQTGVPCEGKSPVNRPG